MRPADLQTLVDRELRHLPLPRAPHTLLPRVLAAVHEWSRRPWYERAWFTWPAAAQAASAAALLLLIAAAYFLADVQAVVAHTSGRLAAAIAAPAQRAEAAINAARIVWHALIEPFVG